LSTGDEDDDLELALGELGEASALRTGPRKRRPDEAFDETARDRGCDDRFPAGDGADGVHDLLRCRILEQEAPGACAEGLPHVLVQIEGREHEDPRRRCALREDPPGRLDPVETRHTDVHHDHVRP
jgi:hypothetical protein